MQSLVVIALISWTCACAAGGPRSFAPSAPEIVYGGRVDLQDPAGPRLAWSGTRLLIGFTGTAITVRGRDLPKRPDVHGRTWPNRLQITVDDGPAVQVMVRPYAGVLFERHDLSAGEHRMEVLKQSEALVGEVQILGVELASGATLRRLATPARRIEFIGDSITAGYGNEGAGPACPFSSATQSAALALPMLVSRQLDADASIVAWSGRGVTRNFGAAPDAETLPRLYDRTLPERPESRWDFQRWAPSVVVVNLGANDFASGVPDAQTFEASYAEFLGQVRAHYSQAWIVVAIGPVISDAWPAGERRRSIAKEYLADIIARRRDDGDTRIDFVEFAQQRSEDGFGCDYHPSLATHRAMAARLLPRLRELLGW